MNRRSFLAGILALGAAPAIVKAANLMPVKAPAIIVPPLFTGEIGRYEGFRFIESPVIDHDDRMDALPKALQFAIGPGGYIIGAALFQPHQGGDCPAIVPPYLELFPRTTAPRR